MTQTKIKATNRSHLFMHRCQSGNVIRARLSVPRPDHRSRFSAVWKWKPTAADLREQQPWLKNLAETANVIGGRHLVLRFVDTQGQPMEFPAAETEAA